MRNVFPFVILCLFAFASCNDNAATGTETKTEPEAASTKSTSSCVEGKWTMTENGVTRAFVFKSDKSGQEEYTATDVRPFDWSMKDDKTVHIVYRAQGDVQSTAYDLNVDCQNNTLKYYGAVYKK